MERADNIFGSAGFGVCVVDLHGGSLYRNQSCQEICACGPDACSTDSCPLAELLALTPQAPLGGCHLVRAHEIRGQLFDVSLVRESDKIFRFLFPLDAKIATLNKVVKGHGLTPRELQVVTLAMLGLANDAIGTRLGMTRNTVRTHLKAIHRKLPRKASALIGRIA